MKSKKKIYCIGHIPKLLSLIKHTPNSVYIPFFSIARLTVHNLLLFVTDYIKFYFCTNLSCPSKTTNLHANSALYRG